PAASTPDTTVQAAQIDLIIDPTPAAVGDASLLVMVTRDGAPLADAPVAVRGDMNHAGMRPVLGEATTDADGKAIIPFRWSMGGDWVVTITVTLPDSSEVSQEFDVSVAT
ncbi:MAG: FixH family protein, partial [Anaerolineae bacterium]|nr:FixH family protein [Anaerolineae bacterium]